MRKTVPTSFKVEFYPEPGNTDALGNILIRARGDEGLAKAKSQAKAMSKSTGDIAYAVACDEDGTTMGHVVYSDGRIASRAGCLA